MSRFTTATSPRPSLLAAVLWAAMLALCGAGEPTSLGDWTSDKILSQLALESATAKAHSDGLRVTFGSSKTGRIDFTPAVPPAAWRTAAGLGMEVQNTSAQAAKLIIHVGSLTGWRLLEAGQTAKLALPLGAAARVPGMKVPPPFEGWGKLQGVKGQLDLKKAPIISLELQAGASASARISQTVLLPPVETTAMVDAFGQYARREWPGKVKDEDGLRVADPEIGSETVPTLDQFGGWIDGPSFSASGWFRAEKADGRWWLVTPEGHAFFSLGVDTVVLQNPTPSKGREKMFAAMPPGSGDTADFYQANLARKFGPEWTPRWQQETLARLNKWGFNTLGAWSDGELPKAQKIAYTVILHVGGDFHRVAIAGGGGKKTVPDPFDPKMAAAISEWMSQHGARYRDDPWLLGYFVSNELPVGTWSGPARYAVVLGALASSASPAKAALVQRLQALYPEVTTLSVRWKTPIRAWDELSDHAFKPPPKWTPELEHDLQTLSTFFAERYYQTVRDALRAADPHHLYLGSRFAASTPEFIAAAAKFCDVTSFNIYRGQVFPADPVMKHFLQFDRPALVSEFHFGASDRGLFGTGQAWAPDQPGRGEAYQAYVASAAAIPNFVGCHWFQYVDQPVSGRPGDGENFAIGLVTITDKPYIELLKIVAHANRTIYVARTTPVKPPLNKGKHGN